MNARLIKDQKINAIHHIIRIKKEKSQIISKDAENAALRSNTHSKFKKKKLAANCKQKGTYKLMKGIYKKKKKLLF